MSIRDNKEEVIRWLDAQDGTAVWVKGAGYDVWSKVCNPTFELKNAIYIVDDEHAELRKQFIDDRSKIEVFFRGKWTDTEYTDLHDFTYGLNNGISHYRIKHKKPVYEWQWICEDTEYTGNGKKFKITNSYYETKNEAQEARMSTRWKVVGPFLDSTRLKAEE